MLGDISKTLGKEFLISAVLPASVLIGTNMLFVRWGLVPRALVADWDVFGVAKPAAILGVIVGAALLLTVASSFLYRVFEGYHVRALAYAAGIGAGAGAVLLMMGTRRAVWRTLLSIGILLALVGAAQWLARKYHRKRAKSWRESLKTLPESRKAMRQFQLVRRYPQDENLLLATAFGNVLRAFEEYPSRLWGIDPITMWARLAAVIPDAAAAQIGDAKITVSLMLNTCVVALWLMVETALLAHPAPGDKWFWASVSWAGVAGVVYAAAIQASLRWGEYVRSAFDLYRLDLLAKMKVELPKGPFTFSDERQVWAGVQLATFYGEDPGGSLHLVVAPKERNASRDPWDAR